MSELSLPFSDPNSLQEKQLTAFYGQLHAATAEGQQTFFDEATGLHVVWDHATVSRFLEGTDEGIGNKTTLDPLTPRSELLQNWKTWPHLLHLLTVPRATANAEGEYHDSIRQALTQGDYGLVSGTKKFGERFGEIVESKVEAGVTSFRDNLHKNGTADLAPYVQHMSSSIISDIIGFSSPEATSNIRGWAESQTNLLGRILDSRGHVTGLRGLASLSKACRQLATEVNNQRPSERQPSLTSNMIEAGLSVRKTAAVAMNIIAAGYATSQGTALNGLNRLLQTDSRMHWQSLDLEGFAPKVVDEVTRLDTDLIGWGRYAKQDISVGEQTIPRGGRIWMLLGAANRDPEVFGIMADQIHSEHAESAQRQLTFGRGKHHCVGRALARQEIRLLYQMLQTAEEDILLDPKRPLRYEADNAFRSPTSLVLTRP